MHGFEKSFGMEPRHLMIGLVPYNWYTSMPAIGTQLKPHSRWRKPGETVGSEVVDTINQTFLLFNISY